MRKYEPSEFHPVEIKNSPIEFIIVGEINSRQRPIAKSETCGLDLVGFAASESFETPKDFDSKSRRKDSENPGFIFQRTSVEADLDGEEILFFWYGAPVSENKSARDDLKRISRLALKDMKYQIDGARNSGDIPDHAGVIEWTVSPLIWFLSEWNDFYAEKFGVRAERLSEQRGSGDADRWLNFVSSRNFTIFTVLVLALLLPDAFRSLVETLSILLNR